MTNVFFWSGACWDLVSWPQGHWEGAETIRGTVTGKNPANQLMLVAYPIICKLIAPTINSIILPGWNQIQQTFQFGLFTT